MIPIKIQIRILWIFKKNINCSFPEHWHELSNGMVRPAANLLSLFFFSITKKKNIEQFKQQTIQQRLYLIYPLMGIKHRYLFKLHTYQLNALLELTEFLIYDKKLLNHIIMNRFRFNGKYYHGPLDKFSNLKFGEFIQADTNFMNYIETNDNQYLYNLIACIYRPAKKNINTTSTDYDGDIRESFNQYQVKIRAQRFARLPKKTINVILFNYQTIRKWLTERYIYVFDNYGNEDNDGTSTHFKETARNEGWKGIIKGMADNVLEIEQYAEQNMHNILDDLDDKILAGLKK